MAKENVKLAYERALTNENASTIGSFGATVRTNEQNNFQTGDVITIQKLHIDESGRLVNEDNQEVVIQEPMMQNGAQVTRTNADGIEEAVTLKYMIVEVKRNGQDTTARLFPTMFWKLRASYALRNGKYVREAQGKIADGDVVEAVKKFVDADKALVAISGKPFTFKRNPVKTSKFGVRDAELTKEQIVDDYVPTLTFVKE